MLRLILPYHLRILAQIEGEVTLELPGSNGAVPPTQRTVLDALEAKYPTLRGTIRDLDTQERRPFIRFFACQRDLSNESPDAPLPETVQDGSEPLMVIGALAGG
jgi:hypothetical protein